MEGLGRLVVAIVGRPAARGSPERSIEAATFGVYWTYGRITMTRVAFLGLEIMGAPMAVNQVRAGFDVAG